MFKKVHFSVPFAFLILVTIQCSEEEVEQPIATAGEMIATLDGKAWKSTTPAAVVANGQLMVTGLGEDGTRIDVVVSELAKKKFVVDGLIGGSTSLNTVSLTPKNADISNPLYTSAYFETTAVGEVTITELDETKKTISGTFTSKVTRLVPSETTIEIKQGSFTDITYTEGQGNIPGNTASLKVNGSAFVAAQVAGVVGFGKLTISMTQGTKGVTLIVPAASATGTFSLESFGSDYSAMYIDGNTSYESTSGALTISKHDKAAKRIEGTFNFSGALFPTGGGTLSVTDGNFALTY